MKQKRKMSDVATKEDLLILENKLKEEIDEIKEELKEEMKTNKDDLMNRLDDVVGQLEAIREDNTIGVYQTSELRESVEDHEKRIARLEKHHAKT